jgi:hypothetical protein
VEKVYSILLNVLTNLEVYPRDAKVNQDHILADRYLVQTKLNTHVKLITIVCDFFCKVSQTLKSRIIIKLKELKVSEEFKINSHPDGLIGLLNRRFFHEDQKGENPAISKI